MLECSSTDLSENSPVRLDLALSCHSVKPQLKYQNLCARTQLLARPLGLSLECHPSSCRPNLAMYCLLRMIQLVHLHSTRCREPARYPDDILYRTRPRNVQGTTKNRRVRAPAAVQFRAVVAGCLFEQPDALCAFAARFLRTFAPDTYRKLRKPIDEYQNGVNVVRIEHLWYKLRKCGGGVVAPPVAAGSTRTS